MFCNESFLLLLLVRFTNCFLSDLGNHLHVFKSLGFADQWLTGINLRDYLLIIDLIVIKILLDNFFLFRSNNTFVLENITQFLNLYSLQIYLFIWMRNNLKSEEQIIGVYFCFWTIEVSKYLEDFLLVAILVAKRSIAWLLLRNVYQRWNIRILQINLRDNLSVANFLYDLELVIWFYLLQYVPFAGGLTIEFLA